MNAVPLPAKMKAIHTPRKEQAELNLAILALEDGTVFEGRSFGAPTERSGEVVFNTALTGYQEIFTDPSYAGQIVILTNPQIGNYGTSAEDNESARPYIEGLAVREFSGIDFVRNFTDRLSLADAHREPLAPDRENFFKPGPKRFVLVGHFLTEIPHKASIPALLRFKPLAGGLRQPFEPLQRAQRGITEVAIDLKGEALKEPFKDLEAEIFLVLEMVIKRSFWYARRMQDRLNSRMVVTPFEKDLPSRLQQSVSR